MPSDKRLPGIGVNAGGETRPAGLQEAFSCVPNTPHNTVDTELSEDPAVPPIEVLSANKHWVELLVHCERSVVSRVQSFLARLETDLPADVMEKVGYAFRELLNNAIEWGGHLDPNLKVRISYIRTRKLLMYRLDDPGPGFKMEDLKHAAVTNPTHHPT